MVARNWRMAEGGITVFLKGGKKVLKLVREITQQWGLPTSPRVHLVARYLITLYKDESL